VIGALIVEFAGSRAEAEAFARQNGVNYPKNKGLSPNSLPFISIPYRNHAQCDAGLKRLAELGWDREFVTITKVDK
jgi:hypothetical protein